MPTITDMAIKLTLDSSNFKAGIGDAKGGMLDLVNGAANVGKRMSGAITMPLLGMTSAALKFSTDFNSSLANVAALGVATEHVEQFKTAIQDMAVETGQTTGELAEGMYQVVSAFGDTADTTKILEVNAKAAAAGLSSVPQAIALTSAVTKGYGDTTAEAVQHVSDLALKTVALGQTTFPELAASMGRVVPIAASLGVSQEELFGVMATATGVTGSAAEVSTQLRGVLQSLMAPTEATSNLIAGLGYSSGTAMLQGEGLQKTIAALVAAAEKSGQPLQSYIGSIEGQTLALALAGPQADVFTEKLKAMGDVTGATDDAFTAQTQGINKAGFAMKQASARTAVFMQKLGDGLAPILSKVLDIIAPLGDYVITLANYFTTADESTQMLVVAIGAVVASIGPLLMIMPNVVTTMQIVSMVLSSLLSPFGLLIAAVGLLAVAWKTNFGDIQGKMSNVLATLRPGFQQLEKWVTMATRGDFSGLKVELGNALESVQIAVGNFKWSDYMPAFSWENKVATMKWGDFVAKLDWVNRVAEFKWGDYAVKIEWEKLIATITWGDYIFTLKWSDVVTTLSDWGTYITSLDWGAYVKGYIDFATYVGKLEWSAYVTAFEWGSYVVAFVWDTYIKPIDWGAIVDGAIDWSLYISDLAWSDVIKPFVWEPYIAPLDWGAIGLTVLDWALWIPVLAWELFITPLKWFSWLVVLSWETMIDPLKWDAFVAKITNWDTWLTVLKWALYINPMSWLTFIATVRWEDYIPVKFMWSKFVEKVNWVDHIPGLTWPTLDPVVWSNFISALSWPKIELPDWGDFIDSLHWPTIEPPNWSDFVDSLHWPTIPSFPGWAEIVRQIAGAFSWGGGASDASSNQTPTPEGPPKTPQNWEPIPKRDPNASTQSIPTNLNGWLNETGQRSAGVVVNNYGDLNNGIDLLVLQQLVRNVLEGAR